MATDEPGKVTPDAAAETKTTDTPATPVVKGTPAPVKTDGDGKETTAAKPVVKEGEATPQPKDDAAIELTVPKGAEKLIDEGDLTHARTLAKAMGWTSVEAQEFLEGEADRLATQSQAWRVEVDNDPVYGGTNAERTQQQASLALDAMWPRGSKEHKELGAILTKSGFGNNRLIVGGLANFGKLMQEDSPTRLKGPTAAKRDAADILYDKKD